MKTAVFILISLLRLFNSEPLHSGDHDLLYDENTLQSPGDLYPLGGMLPSSRVYHSLVCIDYFLVVFGGFSPDGDYLDDTHLFDMRSQQWSGPILRKECCNSKGKVIETLGSAIDFSLPYARVGFEGDLPLARAEHASCSSGGLMYLFGGNSLEYGLLRDLYSFDPVKLRWTDLSDVKGQAPQRRAGHSLVSTPIGGVVVFGGRGIVRGKTSALNDVWMYNPANQTWHYLQPSSPSSPAPSGRQHAAVLVVEDMLVVVGGIDPITNLTTNDVWAFDLAFQEWICLIADGTYRTGFAPPALHSATLVITDSTSLAGNFAEHSLLLYGGIGGGGSCVGPACFQVESTIGQVYGLRLRTHAWDNPRVRILNGRAREQRSVAINASWFFARLTSEVSDRGRLLKPYGLETATYDPHRRLLFDLGGLISTEPAGQRDSGGVQPSVLWDLSTGLDLKAVTPIQVNYPWIFQDSFSQIQPLTAAPKLHFEFLFRTFTFATSDLVLLHTQSNNTLALHPSYY